jgi:branched-chain amino acid transport system ATP-binding protein
LARSDAAADVSGPAAVTAPHTLLAVEDLQVSYGASQAVKGIGLTVAPGEVVALLGANGAGKSTTLRAISGLVRPKSGHVIFDGQRIDKLPPSRIVRIGVAHCPEGRRVFGSLTVVENLRLGAATRRDSSGIAADRERMFSLFPILGERETQSAGTLSGGEQQMLALARALMARPKLLLLDEPSLGIAPIVVQTIYKALDELKEQGVAMLIVEQTISLALTIADRAYVLRTGEVVLSGTSAELKDDYERVAAAYLGARPT